MFELKHLNGFPMWSRFKSNEILFVDGCYRITNHGQHHTKPLEILNAVTIECFCLNCSDIEVVQFYDRINMTQTEVF